MGSPNPIIESQSDIHAAEESPTNTPDNGMLYPRGTAMVFLTASLMLGIFLMTLDTTIICKPDHILRQKYYGTCKAHADS